MALCEDIIDGEKLPAGIKPAMKKNLASFVGVVRKLRRAALKVRFTDCLVADLLGDIRRRSHPHCDREAEVRGVPPLLTARLRPAMGELAGIGACPVAREHD
jgi:hypothetical protein